MRRQIILRTLFFVVFFSIGAAALSGSILCEDLLEYYRNRELLKSAEETLSRLESLNTDYDVLLEQLRRDPNLFERIGPATLGTEREDEETIYPKVTPEQLDAARMALTEQSGERPPEPTMQRWLGRCSEPRRRIILFLAGALLVLISFIWFGSSKDKNEGQK
jgi:hypothetical protein